ncbi:pantoate--beta-alanine ligase [Candidatus Peregrinibacteria bacterium]|nr:pantoate--beta-alanine ligase [Candidatus Peregrinibacteria bacterium]
MRMIRTRSEMERLSKTIKAAGKTIGFVPTMGFLHEGHMSLVRAARQENDVCVVSIFVNPTQFGPSEDFDSYPRDFQKDKKMLAEEKVDVVFCPTVKEMYPNVTLSQTPPDIIPPKNLTACLCGAFRPTHFQGVAQVVDIFFHRVKPDRAYFGQKDFQQTVIIKWLARKAHLNIDIRVLPTIRESDGLAMSSRNVYLKPKERKRVIILFQALQLAKELYENGERNPQRIERKISNLISQNFLTSRNQEMKLQYAEIRDAETLQSIHEIKHPAVVAVAAIIGKTRLIDNIVLG